MPPLSLTGRRQSVLAHMLAPFSPAALESLVDEDFLLVHGCTDIGRRTKKRRINPTTGICYSTTYSDLQMEYRITAEALGLFGLANYHPGQRLDRASSPVLPFLNGVEAFGITGGTLIYEDPVRTRIPGDFPGISFTVVRENASYSGATIPPVTVDSVTTTSGSGGNPGGSRYAAIYGVSTIWTRRLNLIGPVTGLTYFNNALLWFTLPKTTPAPSTIAAFLQDVDHAPEVSGINVIEEVFTTTAVDGTVLRAGTGLIPARLTANEPLGPFNAYNFYWGGIYRGAGGPYNVTSMSNVPDAPAGLTIAQWVALARAPVDAIGATGAAVMHRWAPPTGTVTTLAAADAWIASHSPTASVANSGTPIGTGTAYPGSGTLLLVQAYFIVPITGTYRFRASNVNGFARIRFNPLAGATSAGATDIVTVPSAATTTYSALTGMLRAGDVHYMEFLLGSPSSPCNGFFGYGAAVPINADLLKKANTTLGGTGLMIGDTEVTEVYDFNHSTWL